MRCLIVEGAPVELLRMGLPAIQTVNKRGRIV